MKAFVQTIRRMFCNHHFELDTEIRLTGYERKLVLDSNGEPIIRDTFSDGWSASKTYLYENDYKKPQITVGFERIYLCRKCGSSFIKTVKG